MWKDFLKLKSPDGYQITVGIRYRIFLIINCNFNPLNFIDFAEINIRSIKEVDRLKKVEKYDDGSGFFIFSIKPEINKEKLFRDIENQFNEYFFKEQ
ncbi:MAG: hypothetical protein BGO29_04505 [Bacteroidales bacterium 36-12]|nr:MAG: hypothetical protein BGO29_04505 [Bacteroidales bacterium 36-12]